LTDPVVFLPNSHLPSHLFYRLYPLQFGILHRPHIPLRCSRLNQNRHQYSLLRTLPCLCVFRRSHRFYQANSRQRGRLLRHFILVVSLPHLNQPLKYLIYIQFSHHLSFPVPPDHPQPSLSHR
jgi:hypothetical protein